MILRLNCNVKNLIQILLYRSAFEKKRERNLYIDLYNFRVTSLSYVILLLSCALSYIILELLVTSLLVLLLLPGI